jgi:hypothetical protein
MSTPYHYALGYWNLTVPLDGESSQVMVGDYQNPGPNYVVKAVPAELWSAVQSKFNAHVNKHGMSIYGHAIPPRANWPLTIQLVHKGGGSVHEIRTVLQLVHLYWKDLMKSGPSTANLQYYVDRYIGLYCSGFVGAYADEVLGCARKSPAVNKDILTKFAPYGGLRRTSIENIGPRDIIVWTNGAHVAIIDRILGAGENRKARVVESSLDGGYHGLEISEYVIHGDKPKPKAEDVFRVTRGLPCSKPNVEVYITSPYS